MDTRTANREASQVGLGVIEERIYALARYNAELGIEPPSKVEAKPQYFETQVRAVIDAGLSLLAQVQLRTPHTERLCYQRTQQGLSSLTNSPAVLPEGSRTTFRTN